MKASKSTSGFPRMRKQQKTSKSSLSVNMSKNALLSKLNPNQSSLLQGDGNISALLNKDGAQVQLSK